MHRQNTDPGPPELSSLRDWSAVGEIVSPDVEDGARDPWTQVPRILARIPGFELPARDFLVTEYGAVGNGRADDQTAILRALAVCAHEGGGRVVVPPGDYLTGPLQLPSRTNLHVCAGATLRFTTDSCRYLPPVLTRWEGVECMGLSPFVYARGQRQVAITGDGTLDGQATAGRWWDWAGPWEGEEPTGWTPEQPDQRPARRRLLEAAEAGAPVAERVFADRDRLRPSLVQFHGCADVLVEGVTLRSMPMWGIHPVMSRAVTVRRVRVVSPGPNNDGCVPDSCRDVLVEDCRFDTGDDCLALKSGRNRDGRRLGVPTQDVVIRGCRMRNGHSALAIGSEMSGSIHRVFMERCTMEGPLLEHVLRIKANSTRGGAVGQIHLRDIVAEHARDAAVLIDLRYDENLERGDCWPKVGEVTVERLECGHAGRAIRVDGLPTLPVTGVRVRDCVFRQVDAPNLLSNIEDFSAERSVFGLPL